MPLGETFSILGSWLLNEPVHLAMFYALGVLQIFLWGYMLIAHHLIIRRLQSVELRHDTLIHRMTANAGEILTLKRRQTAEQEKQDGSQT